MLVVAKLKRRETTVTTIDFITDLFCGVDDVLPEAPAG